jgi:fructose-1,6-bisphosphatase/sedoheptulose 1,7-bisphosphatase-like protein
MNGMSGGFPTNQVNPTDNIIKGAGIPTAPPANPLVINLYIDTNDNPELITHWWNQSAAQWEALGTTIKKIRIVQALVTGNNIIPYGTTISSTPVIVEVRNNTTGAEITHRVITETITNVTISVTGAVASARVTIIG